MEGLLCLSKPAKDYAEFEFKASPSENNNADNGNDDAPAKASLSGKLSSASMTSVGSMSAVSNEDLKDFLEQMKWHINNKLDNTRIEMIELRKKVNSIEEKLKMVLGDKDGLSEHGDQDVENRMLEGEDDKGVGEGDGGGGGGGGSIGISKSSIRRGSGSLAKSIKGVFMNSNNNKVDKTSIVGGSSIKSDKQMNGGSLAEEEEVEKRKTVTFGQDVVVKEFQRVFSGKKRSKKGQKVIVREEVPEEDEEEAEAERNGLGYQEQDETQKENGNAEDEDTDDFTDSEGEVENKKANKSLAVIDPAKEREASWRISTAGESKNEYQNTTIGEQPSEDLYEIPVQDEPPALPPTSSRPPIKRVIDEPEDFYEDPDDQESGRGSMPPGSCSDEGSGNTFVFSHKGEKMDHQIEEDFNSDSTEYEDIEDADQELQHQEKQKKPKVDKLEEFKNEHKHEEDIDLIDRLLMLNNYFSTIKSVGKWEKRYCIAKDGQLFIYKSYKDKQSKAQRLPLMGYTIFLLGQQGKQDNVIKIDHHNLKPPLLLASESPEVSNKWLAVLQRYSTINHTIVPGGQPDDDEPEESPEKKKGAKLFSRDKKDGTPQLSMDGDVLSGYVNIYGAKYGEAKIRRKWITIHDMVFSCSASRDEPKNFSFSIRGIDVAAADKKEVKMKGAFKLSKDGEVYLFIEALNMLDAGHLLKKLVSASMNTAPKTNTGGRPQSSSAEESGMVARLLASFESAADQTDSQNFKKKDVKKEESPVISPTESASTEKKETEKERKQREKKEKKEKKEKEKKDKKKKKDKEDTEGPKKVEDTAPSTPPTPSSAPTTPSALDIPETKDEVKKPSPSLQRKPSAALNKFKDSSMSHLLVKDKLMQERKELETKKKDLSTKRADLRAKKMSSSDPEEKEKIQKEIDIVQKELSELSKKLVQVAAEIEGATLDNKDANANRTSDSGISKRASIRASSPDREKVSKGTVSDRMKMFQQGN